MTIYLDIEVLDFFDDPQVAVLPTWRKWSVMRPGCVVFYDGCEWTVAAGDGLQCDRVWERLVAINEPIVTWNGDMFDLPYLAYQARKAGYWGMPEEVAPESLDLMALIKQRTRELTGTERWYSLGAIASVNLNRSKSADGRQAALWLRSGDPVLMNRAITYCCDDVELIYDLHQRLLTGLPLVCPPRPDRNETGWIHVWLDHAAIVPEYV